MSGWGCPNEIHGTCMRVKGRDCDPGMKGCVLHGRFVFANDDKNERLRQKKAREEEAASSSLPPAPQPPEEPS